MFEGLKVLRSRKLTEKDRRANEESVCKLEKEPCILKERYRKMTNIVVRKISELATRKLKL